MRRFITVAPLALLSLTACTKDSATSPPATAAKAEVQKADAPKAAPAVPAGVQVADFPVVVELPAGAVPNDPLGMPGFHSEDGSVSSLIQKDDENSPKDLEAAKKAIEEFAFKKWVKSEKTADGWVLTWVGIGIDMEGKEFDNYPFEVVKKVGDTTYRCSGGVKAAAHVDANVNLCKSLKAMQ
ncbi:MAG: hypothetical protein ACYC8T_15585 [Myxococcaceae bacterium]